MQLDLFNDSSETALRNRLVDALLARDAAACSAAMRALATDWPGDAMLAPAGVLLQALLAQDGPAPNDTATAEAAHLQLLQVVSPAARAALGEASQAWMQAAWGRLAEAVARLPCDPARPEAHAAAAWLRAGDGPRAAASVAAVPSWRRMPQTLQWMVQARALAGETDAIWPLLAELGWMAPQRVAGLAGSGIDPLLSRLWKRYEECLEEDAAWFAAWLLIEHPALLPALRLAEPGQDTAAERGLRLMVQLLGLERQGRQAELVALRKRLRDLNAALFTAYMAAR